MLVAALSAVSCSNDDDICISGEATPRLKLKFKDKNNKLIQLPQIFVDVNYGSGSKNVINQLSADSVMVPLRIDGSGATDLSIYVTENGAKSSLRISYTEQQQYVSPPCGIKKNYHNITAELWGSGPVTDVEQVQNDINDENKTPFYLIF